MSKSKKKLKKKVKALKADMEMAKFANNHFYKENRRLKIAISEILKGLRRGAVDDIVRT